MARLLAFGGVLGLAAANGGYFRESWGWSALVLAWVAALALVLAPRRPRRRELAFLGALAALTAWTALSVLWSQSVPSTVLEVERDLVYLAAVGAALALGGDGLEDGVLAACVVVCAWNLGVRVHGYDHALLGEDALPIGYANGLGLLAAIGCLLALRRRRTLPALAVCLPVLVLAGSYGSWLAAACGLVVAFRPRLAPLVAVGAAIVVVLGMHGHLRDRYWSVALADARANPALGSGAGTYAEQWLLRRTEALDTVDAHSLELETLAELGAVGLALLAVALVIPFSGRGGVALGAYAAFLVQSGIDWEWELPAVTVAGLLCGVAALRAPPFERAPLAVPARAAGVATAVAVAGLALVGLVGNRAADRAADARRTGDDAAALAAARRARTWAPWSAEPLRIEAEVTGDPAPLRRAVAKDPHDWSLWQELAQRSTGPEKRRAAARAARLNPLGTGSASG